MPARHRRGAGGRRHCAGRRTGLGGTRRIRRRWPRAAGRARRAAAPDGGGPVGAPGRVRGRAPGQLVYRAGLRPRCIRSAAAPSAPGHRRPAGRVPGCGGVGRDRAGRAAGHCARGGRRPHGADRPLLADADPPGRPYRRMVAEPGRPPAGPTGVRRRLGRSGAAGSAAPRTGRRPRGRSPSRRQDPGLDPGAHGRPALSAVAPRGSTGAGGTPLRPPRYWCGPAPAADHRNAGRPAVTATHHRGQGHLRHGGALRRSFQTAVAGRSPGRYGRGYRRPHPGAIPLGPATGVQGLIRAAGGGVRPPARSSAPLLPLLDVSRPGLPIDGDRQPGHAGLPVPGPHRAGCVHHVLQHHHPLCDRAGTGRLRRPGRHRRGVRHGAVLPGSGPAPGRRARRQRSGRRARGADPGRGAEAAGRPRRAPCLRRVGGEVRHPQTGVDALPDAPWPY